MSILYALTNESMPGLIKIGHTDRTVEERVTELNSATGVPTSFVPVIVVEVPDASELESSVHQELSDHRVNNSREFFKVSVDQVHDVINSVRHKLLVRQLCALDDNRLAHVIGDVLVKRRRVADKISIEPPKRSY